MNKAERFRIASQTIAVIHARRVRRAAKKACVELQDEQEAAARACWEYYADVRPRIARAIQKLMAQGACTMVAE